MEREARVTAMLRHPNVCLVTDFGHTEDDDTPYLVMELLEGRALSDVLRASRKLGIEETVEIGKQVLSVLHVANEKGIIHRDIKPENLFLVDVVGRPSLVKVLDFGIASADCEEGLTGRGNVIGTPAYMSPEQAAGLPDIDGRTDIYACATVLYECLAGKAPYDGKTKREVMEKIIRGGAPPIASVRLDLPATIGRAIDRAMRVEREARFATALEMIEVLDGSAELPAESWDDETAQLNQLTATPDPPPLRYDDVTEPRVPSIHDVLRRGRR
jgi:eukaryotic-like serine/threonine-protein kinase